MTLEQFRELTKDCPGDTKLMTWSHEELDVVEVTGITYGGDDKKIEFHTDDTD